MPDLSTTYMGLKLRSPLVVSANPLSHKLENILAMEDAGAGAVVLFSPDLMKANPAFVCLSLRTILAA